MKRNILFMTRSIEPFHGKVFITYNKKKKLRKKYLSFLFFIFCNNKITCFLKQKKIRKYDKHEIITDSLCNLV